MHSALADLVVVAHFAFILFIAVGGFLAWRWPRLIWVHVPAVAWGVGIVAIGWDCPLTGVEHDLRERAGEVVEDGFIDRYVEGVIYPERFTSVLRFLVALAVLVGWAGFVVLRKRRQAASAASVRSATEGWQSGLMRQP